VFAGGFTLDLCVELVAAEGDEAARWDIIDALAVLADHSLVAVGAEDPPRYRLLETMRAYALEQLAAGGDEAMLRRRHVERLIDLFAAHSLQTAADAAETNVVAALCLVERYEEAMQRSRSLLDRIDGTSSANRVWAWDGLLESLLQLDRLDEMRAALPRALETDREFDVPMSLPYLAALAMKRGRSEAAARLIGYALQAFAARDMALYDTTRPLIERLAAACAQALGAERSTALIAEGRTMSDDDALAAGCGN
jgi:tetratricopeptide (TPR) repeat protein